MLDDDEARGNCLDAGLRGKIDVQELKVRINAEFAEKQRALRSKEKTKSTGPSAGLGHAEGTEGAEPRDEETD